MYLHQQLLHKITSKFQQHVDRQSFRQLIVETTGQLQEKIQTARILGEPTLTIHHS